MKILFIDTHLYNIDIMLFEDKKLIKSGHIENEKYNSKFLMPTVANVLDNETYDQIVVVNGPGSFTGTRLGVTIAKTLAYTMNKEIKAISYFDLMNFSNENGTSIYGISDGNGYFIAEYIDHKLKGDYIYMSNSEYNEYAKNNDIKTDVIIDYEKVLDGIKNIKCTNPHAVNPIYIKKIGVGNE